CRRTGTASDRLPGQSSQPGELRISQGEGNRVAARSGETQAADQRARFAGAGVYAGSAGRAGAGRGGGVAIGGTRAITGGGAGVRAYAANRGGAGRCVFRLECTSR